MIPSPDLPHTLGALRASDWRSKTVHSELRDNLIARLRSGEPVFPGIVGFERTVVPEISQALLSGHNFILLGLRGQAKTRILRSLPRLLDEWIPAVDGCEIRDDPLKPLCAACHRRLAELGDDLPVRWVGRDERYCEKLATPDVTVADLIGDLDPIKAATRRLELADPEVIHFGLIPRSNRGIFAVNELPDLSGRIQVALFNLLEEGDVQIRGFPVRLPLDLSLVFSANPEDYTSRGNIITPLRDRIASQILTHYPESLEDALAITEQEAWTEREGGVPVHVPEYVRVLIEEVAFQARKSDFVDQRSGVSARMTISLLENVVSAAERRGILCDESPTVARPSDLFAALAAICGKIELVYDGEREGVAQVARVLIGKAVTQVFDARFPDAYQRGEEALKSGEPSVYADVLAWFGAEHTVDVTSDLSSRELYERLAAIPGLEDLARRFLEPQGEAEMAAAMEFVLEGLHQGSLLAKEDLGRSRSYRDMLAEMAESLER